MESNKRQHPRIFTPKVLVRVPSQNRFRAHYLRDLSEGGLFIRTDKPLPVDRIVEIDLEFPGWNDTLNLRGRVVRVDDDEAAQKNNAVGVAVRFEGLSDDTQTRLSQLIAEHTETQATDPEQLDRLRTQVQSLSFELGAAHEALEARSRDLETERARPLLSHETPPGSAGAALPLLAEQAEGFAKRLRQLAQESSVGEGELAELGLERDALLVRVGELEQRLQSDRESFERAQSIAFAEQEVKSRQELERLERSLDERLESVRSELERTHSVAFAAKELEGGEAARGLERTHALALAAAEQEKSVALAELELRGRGLLIAMEQTQSLALSAQELGGRESLVKVERALEEETERRRQAERTDQEQRVRERETIAALEAQVARLSAELLPSQAATAAPLLLTAPIELRAEEREDAPANAPDSTPLDAPGDDSEEPPDDVIIARDPEDDEPVTQPARPLPSMPSVIVDLSSPPVPAVVPRPMSLAPAPTSLPSEPPRASPSTGLDPGELFLDIATTFTPPPIELLSVKVPVESDARSRPGSLAEFIHVEVTEGSGTGSSYFAEPDVSRVDYSEFEKKFRAGTALKRLPKFNWHMPTDPAELQVMGWLEDANSLEAIRSLSRGRLPEERITKVVFEFYCRALIDFARPEIAN